MQRHSTTYNNFTGKMRKRWWLFHATDFQSLMYPCVTFCRIFGMFPYKISASTFKTSKPCYILSTVIVCICCIIDVIIIRDFITSKITFGTIAKNIEGVCFFMCIGFIMICTHILSGPRMRLLQAILEVSSKLPPKLYQKLSRLIHIKDIFGVIIVLIMKIYNFYSNVLNDPTEGFSIYCVLLVFYLHMLYINCICVLKICFKSINDNLAYIRRFAVNDTIRCNPTLISYMQRNQILLIELKKLKKQHLMVSDAVKTLNVIFSPQLLATIVIIFCNMTFELYYYAVRWQNGIVFIGFDKQLYVRIICCIIYHIVLLMLLVWGCETCKNVSYEIRTIIHDLLNNIIDEQIKNELRLFSLQILHCRNIFSAKGFTVDVTLCIEVFGSITMYMLILMQFLITLHSCDEKINIT